jgi:hypothetical protein
MTGCIIAGLGAQASQGIVSQGLVGMTLDGDGPLAGSDDGSTDFVSDVLPYLGAAIGVTGIAAGVVIVAMKKNGNSVSSSSSYPSHKSNQMGYFDSKGTPPNGRTIQL